MRPFRTLAVLGTAMHAAALLAQQQPSTPEAEIARLAEAVAHTQRQMEESQRQLAALQAQIAALQQQIAAQKQAAAADDVAKKIDDLQERQAMQQAQIATHEQTKVETESKFPLRVTGLVLFNGFFNAQGIDSPTTSSFAVPASPGTVAFTMRQTILGLQARGPHLWGAESSAEVNVDFYGRNNLNALNNAGGFLRMRTAKASLRWQNTEAFFSYDRPILAPWTPTSLTAVALPALSWAGTLWTWNPQVGLTHSLPFGTSNRFIAQAALVDIADPPNPSPTFIPVNAGQRSRWPGTTARLAWARGGVDTGFQIGAGGYIAPHRTPAGQSYNSWAATLDFRLPITQHAELTGTAYRGQGLGGLGVGVFKDYVDGSTESYGLDDVGGWVQWKQRATSSLEFNQAFGIDNGFAATLRRNAGLLTGAAYMPLARNREFTSNVIYSPRAYLLFSLEYRYLASSYIRTGTTTSNIFGAAAAYKF